MSISSIVRQSTSPTGRNTVRVILTGQADKSLNDILDQLAGALRAQFKQPGDRCRFWYPKEVFDDYLVANEDESGKLFKLTYSIDGDTVTFGEPVRVEEEYVEVGNGEEAQVSQALLIRQALDKKGFKWRFQVVEWGLSKTRHLWKKDVFAQSLKKHAWENLACFADHPTASQMEELPERSIKDKVGFWTDLEVTEQGLDATLNIKPSAAWLKDDIQAAYDAGNLDFYGASILVAIQTKQVNWTDGKSATEATAVRPISIDLVTDAAAGGRVKYALASNRGQSTLEGATMNKKALALLFKATTRFILVRQALVAARAEGVTAEMNEEQLANAIGNNTALVEQAVNIMEEEPQTTGQSGRVDDQGEIAFERLPQVVRQGLINQAIEDSELPDVVQQNIRSEITPQTTLDEVNTTIERTRKILSLTSQSGQVMDNGRIQVGANSLDKITIGLAKAMQITRAEFEGNESYIEQSVRQSGHTPFKPNESDWNDVPQILSIKQLYVDMTGDRQFRGRVGRVVRQAQNPWATSDFPDLLSNLMHKRVLAGYRANDYGISRVTTLRNITDFKEQIIVVLGYFGDLPTVAENGEYTTFAALSDNKEFWSPTKHGKTVDVNIETIANDDLKSIRTVPDRMGRSAKRTVAKFVWLDCLFNNPTLNQDGLALYHASHNNLITDLLGTVGLENALTKLLMQTEPGSNEKFSVNLKNLTLAVRSDSILKATTLTDFNQEPGGNNDALARLLRQGDERMSITPVALPFLPDSNDWMLLADPTEAEIVELGYWMGNPEPEFYDMMGETHEKAFNNDIITRHKVRIIFGAAPVDFRTSVKSTPVGS